MHYKLYCNIRTWDLSRWYIRSGIPTSSCFQKVFYPRRWMLCTQEGIIYVNIRRYTYRPGKNMLHLPRTEFITQVILYTKDWQGNVNGIYTFTYQSWTEFTHIRSACLFIIMHPTNAIYYIYLQCFNNEMSIFESDCCLLNILLPRPFFVGFVRVGTLVPAHSHIHSGGIFWF